MQEQESFHIIVAKTPEELEKYYNLRHKVLFAPWNQPTSAGKDKLEDISIHKMMVDENNNAIAVGKLHFNNEKEAQIKCLAVDESYQKKGLGVKMLLDMEKTAMEAGAEEMMLNARLTSVAFYEKYGYKFARETPYTLCDGAIVLKEYRKRLVTSL